MKKQILSSNYSITTVKPWRNISESIVTSLSNTAIKSDFRKELSRVSVKNFEPILRPEYQRSVNTFSQMIKPVNDFSQFSDLNPKDQSIQSNDQTWIHEWVSLSSQQRNYVCQNDVVTVLRGQSVWWKSRYPWTCQSWWHINGRGTS